MIITTASGASTASGNPVNGILLAIHAGRGLRRPSAICVGRWTPATRCSNRARPPRMRYAPRFM